jgi:predicted secreted protein with PEFG-CTERM motif
MLVMISSILILIGNEPFTYAISGSIQKFCYTEDYEYIDATGNHFITDVGEQYQFLVNAYNAAVNAIKSSNPTISLEDLHTHLAQGQGYQKMITIESCFENHGINPDDIAHMNSNLSQVVAVPEFGSIAVLVVAISISGVVLISRKFRFHIS